MPGKNWPDRASASRCLQPGVFSLSDAFSSKSTTHRRRLECWSLWVSRRGGTAGPSPTAVDGGRGQPRSLDPAEGPVSDRRLAGAAPVTVRLHEDRCLRALALVASAASDDGVRPVPRSSLPWVCVDAPARLSLWFAHASGRPVPLTQDVRHARKLWRVLEGPQSWPPRAPRRSPQ